MRIAVLALAAALTVTGLSAPALLGGDGPTPALYEVAIPSHESLRPQAMAVVSGLEDATGIHYQHDAGKEGDAPDTCEAVDPERTLVAEDEQPMSAMLLEGDDEADAFMVPLGNEFVGQRLVYDLFSSVGADLTDLSFDIVDAACSQSVFDPDADMYHPERNVPAEPFEPQDGATTFDLPLTDFGCGEEWKFQLKHKGGHFPTALYVEWSNGAYEYVPTDNRDPSQVAKYSTSTDTGYTLSRVMTQMPSAWDGEMSILTGLCDVAEWDIEAPSRGPNGGEFTLVESGAYVLLVTMERGVVDKALDNMKSGQTCHDTGFCLVAFDQLSYESTLNPKGIAA